MVPLSNSMINFPPGFWRRFAPFPCEALTRAYTGVASMVSVMVGVSAGGKVTWSVSGTGVTVGVSLTLTAVEVSITGVDDADSNASGEEVAVETIGKVKVKVGGAEVGIEVGARDCSNEGNFKLLPVIKSTTTTMKISKLPALKTKPFGLVGKKRSAIKVR